MPLKDLMNDIIPDYLKTDHVRTAIKELAAKGYVTLAEYQGLRCNSWEQEYLYPFLTAQALRWLLEKVMLPNCTPKRACYGPCITYDESVIHNFLPLLFKLLRTDNEPEIHEPATAGWVLSTRELTALGIADRISRRRQPESFDAQSVIGVGSTSRETGLASKVRPRDQTKEPGAD